MPEMEAQVEIWKKIVDVQQHFNDLELRIRNFAVVVVGAFLGLGGYALKERDFTEILGPPVILASPIILASLVPLLAFYVMDRLWYHRLLDGSVKAGIEAEARLQELGLKVDLGGQISKASPFKLWFVGKPVHSRHKMDGFYGLLAAAIFALGTALGLAVDPSDAPKQLQEPTAAEIPADVRSTPSLPTPAPPSPTMTVPPSLPTPDKGD